MRICTLGHLDHIPTHWLCDLDRDCSGPPDVHAFQTPGSQKWWRWVLTHHAVKKLVRDRHAHKRATHSHTWSHAISHVHARVHAHIHNQGTHTLEFEENRDPYDNMGGLGTLLADFQICKLCLTQAIIWMPNSYCSLSQASLDNPGEWMFP